MSDCAREGAGGGSAIGSPDDLPELPPASLDAVEDDPAARRRTVGLTDCAEAGSASRGASRSPGSSTRTHHTSRITTAGAAVPGRRIERRHGMVAQE